MNADASPPPPLRVSRAEALSQLREAEASGQIPRALATAASPVAIINAQRQVIYANEPFRALVGAASVDEMCGGRPGEILRCAHADGGCGESEWCEFCGALQAIRETQETGQPAVRECHINADGEERGTALDLLVRATPFRIAERGYVMLGFTDISHQKRRMALEKIFFHDILNTASSLRVYLDLLRRGIADDANRDLLLRLTAICDTLEEEIQGQKIILSAENGTLRTQRDLIEAQDTARQLKAQAEGMEIARGRTVRLAPFSEPFAFISDDSLLKRILGNMVKNALEASPEGAAVTIGFHRDTEGNGIFTVHNPTSMDKDVQRQVFSRYFSTKGKDRGLGTWGMKLLAEEYLGGRVTFSSNAEDGTTFTLTLPRKPADLRTAGR
jgi:signal transduction histidine kinase